MTDQPETPPPETPPSEAPPTEAELWETAKDAIRDCAACWGGPARVAADATLTRPQAKLLRLWIDTLESIVRALLTAMALRLVPSLPSRTRRAAPARSAARPAEPGGAEAAAAGAEAPRCAQEGEGAPSSDEAPPAPSGSESWTGVRLVLAPGGRQRKTRRGRRSGRRGEPDRLVVARALARRFEALIRVVEKPLPWARRLARRLAADRYLAARTLARPRRDEDQPALYDDVVEDALALAWSALAARAPDPDPG